MFYRSCICFLLWAVTAGIAGAQPLSIGNVDAKNLNLPLNDRLTYYVDDAGTKSVEDILDLTEAFLPFEDPALTSVYPEKVWLRGSVMSASDLEDMWLIFRIMGSESNFGYADKLSVWYLANGKMRQEAITGYAVPASQKAIALHSCANAVPFSIAAGDTIEILASIQLLSKHSIPGLVSIVTPDESLFAISRDIIDITTMLRGMYIIIGLFVLAFFFFTRDLSYLYFAISALLFSLHYLVIPPFGIYTTYLFPEHPHTAYWFVLLIGPHSIFFMLFGREFAQTKKLFPKWDRYFIGVIALSVAYYIYSVIINIRPPFVSHFWVIFLQLILLVPICIRLVISPYVNAKVYAIGIFFFLFWNCMGMLTNLDILSLPFNPWPIGQFGFLLIYAVGLGYQLLEGERQKSRSEKIAELDAIKSKFFANISHEFRTPLSLILGPLEHAMEAVPASDTTDTDAEIPVKARHLNVMRRNGMRLQQLIDQLLDLSKLESHKMQLQVNKGKIIRHLQLLMHRFESLAEQRHIHFNTSFPEEPEEAWFDEDKLDKIVVNLLSNAFKYTPENGTVRVAISTAKGLLKISITDSGKGISAEDIDKIFDRFFTVQSNEKKGTGIGLSLAKELVGLHHGQLSVSSELGVGTTFKLSLPYSRSAYGETEVGQAAEGKNVPASLALEAAGQKEFPFENQSDDLPLVLVVEDNADLRQYVGEILQEQFRIATANDGKEGLTAALNSIPDLVVSDVMMPEMNGFELCDALKTNEITSHIPVILLTAKAGTDHKVEGLQTGADDYLTKPFDAKELLIRSANLIQQRRLLREKFKGELMIAPTQVTLTSMDERFMKKVMAEIEANISNEYYTVEELCEAVGYSRSQLFRKLKALCDKSPNELIRTFRLSRAHELLTQKAGTVSEVAYEVGYGNLSYFSRSFKKQYGVLPSELGA